MEKTALVNGVGGFIGYHQLVYLLDRGYRVVATDLDYTENQYGLALQRKDLMNLPARLGKKLGENGKLPLFGKQFIFIPADLTKPEDLRNLFERAADWLGGSIQKVFHIAAIFDLTAPWSIIEKINVQGTIYFLEAASTIPIERIILYSSGAVYKPSFVPQTENMIVDPGEHYPRSKALQEKIALHFVREKNLPILIIRPAGVCGRYSLYGTFVLLKMIAEGQMPFIIGKGRLPCATVHVEDVVAAADFLSSLPHEEMRRRFFTDGFDDSGIFNVNDDTTDFLEDLLFKVSRTLYPTHRAKILPIRVPTWMLEPLVLWQERLAKKYGVRPKIERGLLRFIEEPFSMSNQKLKAFDYQLKHPDIKRELEPLIREYIEEEVL